MQQNYSDAAREKRRQYTREWCQKHKAHRNSKRRERRAVETPEQRELRRAKHREESRAYYQRHIERLRPLRVAQQTKYVKANRAKVYARRERLQLKKREWLAAYKAERGCSRCPERDPICLDFHHRAGKQTGDRWISLMTGWSLARIQKEVAKCDVICSNCHRKLHAAEQSGMWRRKRK